MAGKDVDIFRDMQVSSPSKESFVRAMISIVSLVISDPPSKTEASILAAMMMYQDANGIIKTLADKDSFTDIVLVKGLTKSRGSLNTQICSLSKKNLIVKKEDEFYHVEVSPALMKAFQSDTFSFSMTLEPASGA